MKRWTQNTLMTVVTMNYAVGHEDKISLKAECKKHGQLKRKKKMLTKWSDCDRGLLRQLEGGT